MQFEISTCGDKKTRRKTDGFWKIHAKNMFYHIYTFAFSATCFLSVSGI